MKVSELAEEYQTTGDFILKTLKSLKLKAKDNDQVLNAVVVSVLRGQLEKLGLQPKEIKKSPAQTDKQEKAPTKKKRVRKPTVKKKTISAKKKSEVSSQEDAQEPSRPHPPEAEEKHVGQDTDSKPAPSVKSHEVSKEVPSEARGEDTIEKAKAESVVNAPKVVEKPASAPETRQETSKPKEKSSRKITDAPVITLKPLARKKRKARTDQFPDRGRKGKGRKGAAPPKESQSTQAVEAPLPAVEPRSPEDLKDLEIDLPVTVKDLSVKLQQKSSVILKKLMLMGVFCHINQSLDEEIVNRLLSEFGYKMAKIRTQEEQLIQAHQAEEENPDLLKPRAPVVTFMGHVDHGKTSLLDRIRQSRVADREHGGITQHMSAYSVEIPKGRITFLDTPGHEAFTAMRARGAHITDLVILVVAADEGVMPQTKEAINHARAANVPIVVALNKMDRPGANPDRVKQQLAELDLASEDWGGKTVVVPVSAKTGEGIDELLEMILLEAELLELKANPDKKASGLIVEAHLSQGRGAVTTVIVQSGTLREGDIVVVGPHYGKVKAMFNDCRKSVSEAAPSMPVEILGLPEVPEAGDSFYVVDDEKSAREICLARQEELKNKRLKTAQKITLENLYSHMEGSAVKELNVILKSDVQGSLEALKDSLEKIPSEKVRVNFIHCGVGDVNASDVVLASASKAVILAFHVGIGPRAKEELKKTDVEIRQYRIIYDAVDDMRKALEGMLEAKTKKTFLARVEIREVFKLSKQGTVAGCYVVKGKIHRKDHIDVIRDGEVVFSGIIGSLKRFKDDVREVGEGMECGITIEGFSKYQSGDIIEAYRLERVAQTL